MRTFKIFLGFLGIIASEWLFLSSSQIVGGIFLALNLTCLVKTLEDVE